MNLQRAVWNAPPQLVLAFAETPPQLESSPPLQHQIGRRESRIREYLWERCVAMEVVEVVAEGVVVVWNVGRLELRA